MRIVITGAKHSGKTTVGELVAATLGISFYDTDDQIVSDYQKKTGSLMSVRDIMGLLGNTEFRALERESMQKVLVHDFCVVSTGGGAVLESETRKLIFADSIVVHLCADENLLWSRIEKNGIPAFYQGEGGRAKHKVRVELIDEVMRPRADIIMEITSANESSVAEDLLNRIGEALECRMRSPSSFGEVIRVTTFGESHGPAVGAVLDGIKPRTEISEADIQSELDRRRPGQSSVSTPRNEKDRVKILSGVFEGRTTGHPICMVVFNEDHDSSKYDNLRDLFRPGHADFTFWKKYGIRDHRGGGRSSGRETIGRVAPGAIAQKILLSRGVTITAFSSEIAGVKGSVEDFSVIESNPVRAADPQAAKLMEKAILDAKERHDSVGGMVKLVMEGVPAGLGDPVFFKLDARLASAIFSIGAVKGVEVGAGFSAARMTGSENNDAMKSDEFSSTNAGGILGGISTGAEIILHIAVKPTPSILRSQSTIDKTGQNRKIEISGRHDPCIVPRIIPVIESMAALVLLDAWEINDRLGRYNEDI